MILELRVRDLALVASAEVRFSEGLNLLTGETGSGKSLIVDALGLALGARASSDVIRRGSHRAIAEAVFDISDRPEVGQVLEEMGIEPEEVLVLSREVAAGAGRGGARINGRPAGPAQLRRLGVMLVGIHGQHEQQGLLDPAAQLELIDAFGARSHGIAAAAGAVAGRHEAWAAARDRLSQLEATAAQDRRELEFARFQLAQLEAATPTLGEDVALAAERSVARHASRLLELLGEAAEALRTEPGVALVRARLEAAARLDPRLEEAARRAAALDEEARDLLVWLVGHAGTIDADPARLEQIESRLSILEDLKRRYGGSLEQVLEEWAALRRRVEGVDNLGESIERARGEERARRRELEDAATALTEARAGAARRLAGLVATELAGLGLSGARFEISLHGAELGPGGRDGVEMRFTANPGEPMAALARVASGGELARVMLAIKSATAEVDRLPTLVFDEVDAGIGGEVARQVGLRLKQLGAHRQVLVVTHLAQIAAFAGHHLAVRKQESSDGRRVVLVEELRERRARAEELARMMSGAVTAKAVARAEEMLRESAAGVSR